MKTITVKKHCVIIILIKLVLLFAGATLAEILFCQHHPILLFVLGLFCIAAWRTADKCAAHWCFVPGHSFIVKNGKVINIIEEPCMVWMKGDMKGCTIVDYEDVSSARTCLITLALPNDGGTVAEIEIAITVGVDKTLGGLHRYYHGRAKIKGIKEYLGSILSDFYKYEDAIFSRGYLTMIGETPEQWREHVLKPKLKRYIERELFNDGVFAYAPAVAIHTFKDKIHVGV